MGKGEGGGGEGGGLTVANATGAASNQADLQIGKEILRHSFPFQSLEFLFDRSLALPFTEKRF